MLLGILLIVLTAWYIVYSVRRRRLYKLAAKFDGPPPIPLLGNALKCLTPPTEVLEAMLKGAEYYKSPIRFWLGPHLVICIWNPNDLKTILNSSHTIDKPPLLYEIIEEVVGKGLITLPGEVWKRHRRLISPIFNQENLDSCCETFSSYCKRFTENLKNEVGKVGFDIETHVVHCVFSLFVDSFLGYKTDIANPNSFQGVMHSLARILESLASRLSNPLYLSNFFFKRSPAGKQFESETINYNKFIELVIQNWKDNSMKHHMKDKEDLFYTTDGTNAKNFVEHLHLVADDMGKLTANELTDEVKTFIGASLETTHSIMSFLLILLGMHPDIQETVYQEIIQVLGTREDVCWNDLKEFEYLDRVIKEVLRIFPVVGGIARYCDQEIQLENHIIPANTIVIASLWNLHRDPHIWPNPSKFDPDRFLPEEEAKRHPYSWIPFSAGPRNCIGNKFGLMALKVMTIHVISKYKVSTPYRDVDDVHLTMRFTIKPTNGFKISIVAR